VYQHILINKKANERHLRLLIL